MNTTVKQYRQLLSQVPGDQVKKIKTILEKHMDSWYLIDADLMIDLLDDKNITAADLVETLKSIAEFDAENTDLKHAVMAMDLLLKDEHRYKVHQKMDETLLNDENHHDNDPILAFYGHAGFADDVRLAS